MKSWTRRDVLRTGAAASAGAFASSDAFALNNNKESILPPRTESSLPDAEEIAHSETGTPLRERLSLDFGWRFHLGHADDPAKDFGFGLTPTPFAKTGQFAAPGRLDFDDSAWRALDLPHDWAIELPFLDVPHVIKTGCKPLGRDYPATSIGWYRRVFDIPASDAEENGSQSSLRVYSGMLRSFSTVAFRRKPKRLCALSLRHNQFCSPWRKKCSRRPSGCFDERRVVL